MADICQKVINQYKNKRIRLVRAGVSDKSKVIEIADSGLLVNTREKSGKMIKAQLVRLDDVLKNIDVTFIKMDIEGEEILALKGAENIIKK